MKRWWIGALAVTGFGILWAFSAQPVAAAFDVMADTDNLFTYPGQPRDYVVNPLYERIDRVFVRELISSRKNAAEVELPKDKWTFSPGERSLKIDRDVDLERFQVYVHGVRKKPYTFFEPVPVIGNSVRVVLDGRIAIKDRDFRFDPVGNTIQVPDFGPRSMVQYRTIDDRTMSCGDFTAENLTRTIERYFEWPETGNMVSKAGFPGVYTSGNHWTRVWLVQLLPVADNVTGVSLGDEGWTFEPKTQELTLKNPVDSSQFTVQAYGSPEPTGP